MRNSVWRTGMTLLLSATVFLGATMPPAVQHAHANGGQTHNHEATHLDDHAHSHPHPHQAQQPSPDEMQTMHFHLTFFGLDFHLPVGDPQNLPHEGPNIPGDQTETLVRLLDTEVIFVSALVGDWLFVSLPSPEGMARIGAEITPSRSGWDTHVSLPLCDSARGERSGVQLI